MFNGLQNGGPSLADWISSIGTMFAVFVALGGYGLSECQRRKSLTAANLGHALQIGYKLTVLNADAKHVHQHLFKNATIEDQNERSLLWRKLQPELGMEAMTGPQLNSQEQNLLIILLEAEILMAISEVSRRNEIIRKAMSEYRIKRELLQEKSPPPVEFSGSVGVFELSGNDVLRLSPWTAVLEDLVIQMRNLTVINFEATKALNVQYTAMMRKHYPGKKFLISE